MKAYTNSRLAVLTALIAATLSSPASATVVNLDATSNNKVTISLSTGSYNVFDVGPGDIAGAIYKAWNPWGYVAYCDTDGANCSYGWWREWLVDYGVGTVRNNNLEEFFSTPELALAASKLNDPFTFTLVSQTDVQFWIGDSLYWDNLDGVSLNIVKVTNGGGGGGSVPEPATLALLGLGLAGLGFARRRA